MWLGVVGLSPGGREGKDELLGSARVARRSVDGSGGGRVRRPEL